MKNKVKKYEYKLEKDTSIVNELHHMIHIKYLKNEK